jgi:hypothetical protein
MRRRAGWPTAILLTANVVAKDGGKEIIRGNNKVIAVCLWMQSSSGTRTASRSWKRCCPSWRT